MTAAGAAAGHPGQQRGRHYADASDAEQLKDLQSNEHAEEHHALRRCWQSAPQRCHVKSYRCGTESHVFASAQGVNILPTLPLYKTCFASAAGACGWPERLPCGGSPPWPSAPFPAASCEAPASDAVLEMPRERMCCGADCRAGCGHMLALAKFERHDRLMASGLRVASWCDFRLERFCAALSDCANAWCAKLVACKLHSNCAGAGVASLVGPSACLRCPMAPDGSS